MYSIMVDKVFSQPWFWLVMMPLVAACVAGAYDKNDLMVGMFITAGLFGLGIGWYKAMP